MRPEERNKRIADFFSREYGRLVAYARSLADAVADQEPEDVIQDVMAGIFGLADLSRPIENLAGYVYQAIRNRVIDLFRRRKKTVSLDQQVSEDVPALAETIRDERLETDTLVDRRDVGRRLTSAFDGLNDREKAVVFATEIEGRSFEELSRDWDEPVGTLLSRKSRAMSKLEKHFLAPKKAKKAKEVGHGP